MNEETIKMLNMINEKIKKCKKDNNVNTLLAIPLGSHGEFGYLTDKMLNEIIETQQENAQSKDKLNKISDLLNEPIFEYDNIPCNIENEIIQLKEILKEN